MSVLNAHVPRQLVEELEVRFPPRCLQPKDDVNEALFYAGGVSMIEYLRLSYERQQEMSTAVLEPLAVIPHPEYDE